jgi:hypothetical protein
MTTGGRFSAKPFARAQCVLRCTVILSPNGLARILNPARLAGGDSLFLLLQAAEQGAPQAEEHALKLAERDGFESWTGLYAWHLAQAGPSEDGNLRRELIGWAYDTLTVGADETAGAV